MAYLARWALEAPPEKQALRVFKRRFALHFGSVVCGWRTLFGNCRLVSFEKFKKACCVLQFADRAAEYWSELDIGLGGCISLFEMDPDTTVLLAKLHARIAAVLDGQRPEDVAADVVFQRLTTVANLRAPDRMDIQQFRLMAKSLGLTDAEAGRAFNCLDIKGGRNPPALVTVKDVAWLKGLSALVDIEAVVLPPTCSPLDELEEDWRTPEPQEAEASSPSSPRRPAETHAAPRVALKVANAAAVGRTSSTAKVAAAAKAAPPPRAARGAPAGPKRAAATPAAAAAAGGALLAAAGGAVASGRGSRGGRPEEARAALGGDAAEAAADAAPAPAPPGGEGEEPEAAVGARADEAADAEGEEEGIEEDEDGKDAVEEEATDTEEDEEEQEEEEEEDEGQKDTDEEEAEGEEWVDGAVEDEAEDEPEDAEAGVGLQDDVEEAF
ncbi:unnamed protein product [Prorocentrum cordatum]|uniref:FACT complex subunit n=1 Tax=Prorocentrum cordatum TaxID=2364126 RepID=A0ABN9YFC7_9DINO|nr:unnamed protein product [Polarella glacialis]